MPASMLTPAKSPQSPATASSPRRIEWPASLPTLPRTTIVPPGHSAHAAAVGGARQIAALPSTSIRPPRISAPSQSLAFPRTWDLASVHLAAHVATGIAFDVNCTRFHASADPVYALE